MAALDLFGRRWNLRIVWELHHRPVGFRALQQRCDNMSSSVLRQRLTELLDAHLVAQRTCARCGCEYEWGVHVMVFADRAGLTPAEVTSLTCGSPDDPCWPAGREAMLIRMVDALHDSCDVDDELWRSAQEMFDEQQLLDVALLCGWYHAICFAARMARVDLEPGAPRFADVTAA